MTSRRLRRRDRTTAMAIMTKRERVLRAARFEETDRVPVFDILQNETIIEHYAGQKLTPENGDHLAGVAAGAVLDMTRFVGGPQRTGRGQTDDGLVMQIEPWSAWVIERPFEDVAGFAVWVEERIRDANTKAYGQAHAELLGRMVEQQWAAFAEGDPTGRLDPAMYVLESSVGLNPMFTGPGLEMFTLLAAERPGLVEEWLEANHRAELRRVAAIADPHYVPIALVFDDIAHKTGTIFPPDWLRDLWLPRLKRLVDAWHEHDTLCLFHSDGNLWDIMDDLVAAGIDGLNPLETLAGMTVKDVRAKYPGLFLAGGIDVSQLLPFGTPDKVRDTCRQAIADTEAKGYFLGSTTLLHAGVPLDNAIAMFDTPVELSRERYQPAGAHGATERQEVYRCETCGGMVVVLRGGPGELRCCEAPMALVKAADIEAVPEASDLLNPPAMEHNLNMPVKTAMAFIQKRIANKTTYFGVKTLKNPLDFWVYREIIVEVQPDVIVEVGTAYGGGALAMAHILDHLGKGRIIGLDHQHETVPAFVKEHPRITLFSGEACQSFPKVQAAIQSGETVLVIEDSSHSYENTLAVLQTYGPLVTLGSYLIIEDSNCHHGVDIGPCPGPYEAVEQFLRETDDFEVDRSRESFFITWNPRGYLKRVRG